MARIRTFIVPSIRAKAIRDRLVSLQEKLANSAAEVKWVEPANLHLTLLFLGEVDERDLLDVCRAVSDVTAQTTAFTMSIEGNRLLSESTSAARLSGSVPEARARRNDHSARRPGKAAAQAGLLSPRGS